MLFSACLRLTPFFLSTPVETLLSSKPHFSLCLVLGISSTIFHPKKKKIHKLFINYIKASFLLLSMDPMMHGSAETSSEETDHHQEDQEDHTKRSYDCTFCRRGFTNAQALGGHMNIHRKDKAKSKRGTSNSSSLPNKFTNEESMASPFIPQISSQTSTCYTIFEPHQRNCDNIRFQPSSASYPINPPAYAFQYEFLNPTRYHQSLSTNQGLQGPNLSLQVGPSHASTDHVRRGIQKDGEVVDLELRLGHDPY